MTPQTFVKRWGQIQLKETAAAQACFNYCVAQGVGDIHGLDGDGDACESLP